MKHETAERKEDREGEVFIKSGIEFKIFDKDIESDKELSGYGEG